MAGLLINIVGLYEIRAILLFFALLFTVAYAHDLRDICILNKEELKCKWVGAGVYMTQMPIQTLEGWCLNVSSVRAPPASKQHRYVEIIQGTAKCINVLATARTVVIVNGQKCNVSTSGKSVRKMERV